MASFQGRGGLENLGPFFFAAVVEFEILAAVEADEVGEDLDLRGGEVAVGAVELAEDVAGIDEEDFPGAVAGLFPLSKNQRVHGSVTV